MRRIVLLIASTALSVRRACPLAVALMVGMLLVFWVGTSPTQAQEATTGQAGVMAWGWNESGQLGNGTTTEFSTTPGHVIGLESRVQSIAGGYLHSLALKDDGTVWAWGRNEMGALGNGTKTDSNTPVQVSGLSGVQAIAGGDLHSLALKNDGTVWAWGHNAFGQLGNAINTHSNTPVQVSGLSGVQSIAGGGYHSLALKDDGTVWAWGANDVGQLGNGTRDDDAHTIPVQVSGLSDVQAIAGGGYHSLALPSPTGPQTKADCKNGGWKDFGFKNQGQCIKAVKKAS